MSLLSSGQVMKALIITIKMDMCIVMNRWNIFLIKKSD